jgi:hypothetical protein
MPRDRRGARRLLPFFATWIVLVPSSLGAQVGQMGDRPALVPVEGILTDEKGGPLAGLTVEVRENWEMLEYAKTDREGRFRLVVDVRPGEFTLVVLREGKIAAEERLFLPPLDKGGTLKVVVKSAAIAKPAIRPKQTGPAKPPQGNPKPPAEKKPRPPSSTSG